MIILIILCIGVITATAWLLSRTLLRHRKRLWEERLKSLSYVTEADMIGNIGVSVIALHPQDVRIVEAILDSHYTAFEAIIVTDSRSELFTELRRRFALCSVYCDHASIRGLYRSHYKAFGRLIVVDGFATSRTSLLDMAASIASFDYLLPLPSNAILLPDSLSRLVVEIATADTSRIREIRGLFDELGIVSAERVAECGGFGPLYASYAKKNQPTKERGTLHIAHPVALPAESLSEKGFFIFSQMRTYNFYDFLQFNIMKYRKKFVSLIKP